MFQNLYSAKLTSYIQESQKSSLKINGESDNPILALDFKKYLSIGERKEAEDDSLQWAFDSKQPILQLYSPLLSCIYAMNRHARLEGNVAVGENLHEFTGAQRKDIRSTMGQSSQSWEGQRCPGSCSGLGSLNPGFGAWPHPSFTP